MWRGQPSWLATFPADATVLPRWSSEYQGGSNGPAPGGCLLLLPFCGPCTMAAFATPGGAAPGISEEGLGTEGTVVEVHDPCHPRMVVRFDSLYVFRQPRLLVF